MADVLIYALAYGGQKLHNKLVDARSPLIPIPTSSDLATSADSLPPFSDLAPVYSVEPEHPTPRESASPTQPSSRAPLTASATRPGAGRTLSISPTSNLVSRPATNRSRSHSTPARKVPELTEFGLKELHLAWRIRYQSLFLRLSALLDALRRGLRNSWAGRPSWELCDALRAAILEAEYVEKRLGEAVRWCGAQGLQKMPLKDFVSKPAKRRGSVSRPMHSEYPPSLSTLPYPIPPALPAAFSKLTVPLPPDVLRGTSRSGPNEDDLPPAYTRRHDPLRGERLLEGATWQPFERDMYDLDPVRTRSRGG
ncbi:hypothetical protein JCM10212_005800 [Sporobolomyces blumeae]